MSDSFKSESGKVVSIPEQRLAEQVKRKGYIGDTPPSPVFPLLERMKALHLKKVRMYCGASPDPLINYKRAAQAVGIEPWRYVQARVFEKQERMKAILTLDPEEMMKALKEELVDTALQDLIALALILEAEEENLK